MKTHKIFKQAELSTPIGILTITAEESCIHSITLQPVDLLFTVGSRTDAAPQKRCKVVRTDRLPLLKETVIQLSEYFEGKRTQFTLPLDFDQNYLDPEKRPSLFRKKVWHALCAIPYGGTRSYAHIARSIRNPNAVRAVGGAANANPFIIVIPCHRVINADGSIGGYAGGVMAKKYLLALEAQRTSVAFVRTQ